MPRRSTGCEKCRQRKVRCDEIKPHCRRCQEYGVPCPGYRLPAGKDIHFVDQTVVVARKASRGTGITSWPSNPSRHGSTQTYRWQHKFGGPMTIRTSSPNDIDHRHVHRIQLLGTFLNLYLPRGRDPALTSHFDYIAALPGIDLSFSLLQISIDALCLAELGSLYTDERCLQEARGYYVRALPMLAHELRKPTSRQLRKDHILAVIAVLTLCEQIAPIAQGSPKNQGWINHVQGGEKYLQAHGGEILKASFGRLLFHNIRHSSLALGIAKRKASIFADQKWLRLAQDMAKGNPYMALFNLCILLPGLLERADALFHSLSFESDFIQVCKDMFRLQQDLWKWKHQFYKPDPYTPVDISQMEAFCNLCPDRTFITVFDFPAAQICVQFQLFWIINLLLDFTISELYRVLGRTHLLPRLSDLSSSRSESDVQRDTFIFATNYCRCIPYCCEPETASPGRMGNFLLHIVSAYFEVCGHEQESSWCRSVRRMLEDEKMLPSGKPSSANSPLSFGTGPNVKTPKMNFTIPCIGTPCPILLQGGKPSCR